MGPRGWALVRRRDVQLLLLDAALRERLLVRLARLLRAAARVGGGVRGRGNCQVSAGPREKKREGKARVDSAQMDRRQNQ